MKKLLISALLFGLCYSTVHATYSRIESMGKSSTYIMDDMSIFDNPANIGIYPNYLIGEMGSYLEEQSKGDNYDPQHPWFGGIFSLGLGKEDGGDPRLSIAGAFNRIDQKLFRFFPDYVLLRDGSSSYTGADTTLVKAIIKNDAIPGQEQGRIVEIPKPTTNFDGFLGFSTQKGDLFGLHIYVAYQDGAVKSDDGLDLLDPNANSSVIKLDGGANFQVNQRIDAEVALGVASLQYSNGKFIDFGNLSYMANARLFSTIEALNGELVPTASYASYVLPGRETSELQFGLGINVSMDDQGFFWLGLDFIRNYSEFEAGSVSVGQLAYPGFYNHDGDVYYSTFRSSNNEPVKDVMTETGGKISFGIERSIWWDWFIIRVGGQKVITYVDCQLGVETDGYCGEFVEPNGSGNYMRTNPAGDGTNEDHIGFGFGINVEEKLKVDVTVAEDLLYRNPFAGEGRLFSRISATYSF